VGEDALSRGYRLRPALRFLPVSGVGRPWSPDPRRLLTPVLAKSVCATRSVTGANSLAHCVLVSESSCVSGGMRRQMPSRVSKKSRFLNIRLPSKSSTYASILGRTGSIESHGKELRVRWSA
jgi:hypothetical protein